MAFCVNCGRPLNQGDSFCPNCGKQVAMQEQPRIAAESQNVNTDETVLVQQKKALPPPPNYLTRAIVMTILLFPTGIGGIVHAAKSLTAYSQNNYELAMSESELAAKWCRRTVVFGIVFWSCFIFLYIILILSALSY